MFQILGHKLLGLAFFTRRAWNSYQSLKKGNDLIFNFLCSSQNLFFIMLSRIRTAYSLNLVAMKTLANLTPSFALDTSRLTRQSYLEIAPSTRFIALSVLLSPSINCSSVIQRGGAIKRTFHREYPVTPSAFI